MLIIELAWGLYWENIGAVLFCLVHELVKNKRERDQYFRSTVQQLVQ